MVKSYDFCLIARAIAEKYRTAYGKGMCGQVITEKSVKAIAKYYPDWYKSHDALLKSEYGAFGFDCVCLVKSILWGWNGDESAQFGGAVYLSNDVPDVGTEGMYDLCTVKSKDFTKIKPGAYLHLQGHAGIYIGDGLAVECTLNKSRTRNGVIISAVKNIGEKSGYPSREWTEWGLLPWVDYSDQTSVCYYVETRPCKKGEKGEAVKNLQIKIAQLSPEWEAEVKAHSYKDGDFDGSYGSGLKNTVDKLRAELGLAKGSCNDELCEILNRNAIDYVGSIRQAIKDLQEGI